MVPYPSDVLLDLREVPGPIDDAPRGVPDTPSTHQPTARALRALRCDIPVQKASVPCLKRLYLNVHTCMTGIRTLTPHSDRLTVSSSDLPSNFQPSTQHSVAPTNSYMNCASPKNPTVVHQRTTEARQETRAQMLTSDRWSISHSDFTLKPQLSPELLCLCLLHPQHHLLC